jgi:outer membrane lipoprotein-sorting protein
VNAPRLLSSGVLALTLAACATVGPPARSLVADDASEAIARLVARWREFTDLRAVADLTFRRGTTTQRLSGVVLAKSPDSVRFEALTPFGTPFLLLTVSDRVLTAYNVLEARALIGPLNGQTTGRWLGVPLEADQVVGLLTGRVVPARDIVAAEVLAPDAEGRSVRIEGRIEGKTQSQRVWMDFETGVVRRVEISGGRIGMLVTYSREGGDEFPTAIRVSSSDVEMEATVGYRSASMGGGVDGARFSLVLPETVRIQRFR